MNAFFEKSPNKVHVVHVITRFDKGGSAENTFLTVRDLDKERYQVTLIHGSSCESQMGQAEQSAAQKNLSEARLRGVNIMALPTLVRNIHLIKDLQAFYSLVRIFGQLGPDIVHTHTSKAGLLGRWAAWLARVPYIVHTPHGHVFWGYFSNKVSKLFIILERMTALITNHLIMLTLQEKKDHLHVHIAPENKLTVIHSGVDFRSFKEQTQDRETMRQRLDIEADVFVIGSVGRLTPVKGHRYLLEALASLSPRTRNIITILLGEGELRNDLEELALRLNIQDRVRFLGWRDDVAPVISTFDVFAFPSLNEGMGKALVEAMYMGKPVVASDVGGISNLVVSEENGILVPPGNAESLAKSIELLYQNEGLRRAMGDNGKLKSECYSSSLMIRKIEALYSELKA